MDHILIVEDDRYVQKALKRLFESEGYRVEISGDGKTRQWGRVSERRCPITLGIVFNSENW